MNTLTCEHGRKEVRRMTASNGVVHYVRQCLDCGHNCGAVPKAPGLRGRPPPWDEALRQDWARKCREHFAGRQAAQASERDAAWWARYDEVMASPEWRERRRLVMLRSGGVCEGCGRKQAVHVHHLSYANLGDEFLWELRAVCEACHARIHPHRFGQRAPAAGDEPGAAAAG
jgi:5-methylcytosine-specific restriction endonuclease McrA